ncbi:MAG: hypothetical protein IH872_01905 [Chloroflexi bacterium]|nr:hypothetical protein [Chloroflexota bacterium]
MGSLLFEQERLAQGFDGVLDPIFQEMSASGDLLTEAQPFSQRRDEIHDTHQRSITIAEG